MNKIRSVLMFGTLPPPVGGVTISVQNLVSALRKKKVSVGFIGKGLMSYYDIAHIHSYRPWKRFVLLCLGKLRAKRNVFTIHGMHFDQRDLFNRLSLCLTDGIVVLNDEVLLQAPKLSQKTLLKVSSIVEEGIEQQGFNQPLLPKTGKPKVLVYAQHGGEFEGESIYGIPFIKSLLSKLNEKYTLVIADVSHHYPELSDYDEKDVIHLSKAVNFVQLLSEVDVYLRPTSKDGDAVSIHEALLTQTPVVASNVVTRPLGVFCYDYLNEESFLDALDNALTAKGNPLNCAFIEY